MVFDERLFQAVVLKSLQISERKFRRDLTLGEIEEWDSVAHLVLVSEIEEAFGVRFKAEEIVEFTSLERLRDGIISQMS